MPEIHFNNQNWPKAFWWHEIQDEFQREQQNQEASSRKTMILTKAKAIFRKIPNMTTLKFVRDVLLQSHHYKCHSANHLVDLYLKSIGKQVQVDKFEARFNTRPTNISCYKDVPMEHNSEEIWPRSSTTLTMWSWNSNLMTCLETQTNLHSPINLIT